MTFYAHSLPGQPVDRWETMDQHETLVAHFASQFLARIQPDFVSWGDLLGRWHDIGKYSSEFQTYLHKANNLLDQLPDAHQADVGDKVDHSTAAAQLAISRRSNLSLELEYSYSVESLKMSRARLNPRPTGAKNKKISKVGRHDRCCQRLFNTQTSHAGLYK